MLFNEQPQMDKAAFRTESDVKSMFHQAAGVFGGFDILVNNAGGAWLEQDFAEIDTQHWNQAIRFEIPHMRLQQWGRIASSEK